MNLQLSEAVYFCIMSNRLCLVLKCIGTTGFTLASVLTFGQDSLFIMRGTWDQLPEAPEVLRLNTSADWSEQNAVFEREAATASNLIVVNADTTSHVWALLIGEAIGFAYEKRPNMARGVCIDTTRFEAVAASRLKTAFCSDQSAEAFSLSTSGASGI